MTERCSAKWCTMMIAAIMASAIIVVTVVSGDTTVVKKVERRSHRDFYSIENTTLTCNGLTYLVIENDCANNSELMRGMTIGQVLLACYSYGQYNYVYIGPFRM